MLSKEKFEEEQDRAFEFHQRMKMHMDIHEVFYDTPVGPSPLMVSKRLTDAGE